MTANPTPAPAATWDRLAPLIVLAAAFGALLFHALWNPLDHDELETVHHGFRMARGLALYCDFPEIHPALPMTAASFVISWLGEASRTLVALRLLGVFVAVCALVALQRTVAARSGESAGLWSAALLASYGAFLQTAFQIRGDGPMLLLTLIAVALLAGGAPMGALGAGLALGAAAFCKQSALFFVPAAGLWLVLSGGRATARLGRTALFGLGALAPFAFTVLWYRACLDDFAALYFLIPPMAQALFANADTLLGRVVWGSPVQWGLGLAGAGLAVGAARRKDYVPLLYALLLAAALFFVLRARVYFPQNYVPAAAMLALLGGPVLARGLGRLVGARRAALSAAVAGALLAQGALYAYAEHRKFADAFAPDPEARALRWQGCYAQSGVLGPARFSDMLRCARRVGEPVLPHRGGPPKRTMTFSDQRALVDWIVSHTDPEAVVWGMEPVYAFRHSPEDLSPPMLGVFSDLEEAARIVTTRNLRAGRVPLLKYMRVMDVSERGFGDALARTLEAGGTEAVVLDASTAGLAAAFPAFEAWLEANFSVLFEPRSGVHVAVRAPGG